MLVATCHPLNVVIAVFLNQLVYNHALSLWWVFHWEYALQPKVLILTETIWVSLHDNNGEMLCGYLNRLQYNPDYLFVCLYSVCS